MRLLVSHQLPASHFCQPHAHSLFYYLHVITKMVLLCVTVADINSRKALLDNYSYTFGSSLQDIELPVPFKEVYIRNISCYEPVESSITQRMIQFAFTVLKKLQYRCKCRILSAMHTVFKTKDKKVALYIFVHYYHLTCVTIYQIMKYKNNEIMS